MATTPKANGKQSRVLITGARGYIGRLVVNALAADHRKLETVVATDIQDVEDAKNQDNIICEKADIRSDRIGELIDEHQIDTVVHLAAVMSPGIPRETAYEIDVGGTKKLLDACISKNVRKLIVCSSGAVYGYHADNSPALDENDPLRGNEVFAYAHHKQLIEEMLASSRQKHPELNQLIFRPGTVLGKSVNNQITNLFEKRFIVGVKGAATPFVFIWDEDVAQCIVEGVHNDKVGIFNMAGDGVMTLREIAARLKKPYVALPPWLLKGALTQLSRHGITKYGPEQVMFLQYRPVLSNRRLKEDFGFVPRKTTREVFEIYCGNP